MDQGNAALTTGSSRRARWLRFLLLGTGLLVEGSLSSGNCWAQQFVGVSQVGISKSGLVLNRATDTYNSVVTVTNNSSLVLSGPLALVVSKLTPTSVTLANASGQDSARNPYVNLAVPTDGLSPNRSISNVLLAFSNPSRVAFSFSLAVEMIEVVPEPLPQGISGPVITSLPPAAAVVGKPMQYQVITSSANPASLTYSLSTAPAGMTIGATTGLTQWTPAANETGDQSVTIVAQDLTGQTSQSFTLSVFGTSPGTSVLISAMNGGLITISDPSSPINGLSINIPAGALAADTTITISALISPPTLGGSQRFFLEGFSVEPDGTSLAIPATVTFPYNVSQFSTNQGITSESFLGVYFVRTSTGNLELLNNFAVDKVKHVLKGTVPHFSGYLFSNISRLCPPPLADHSNDCPDVYAPSMPSTLLPAVLVHGFQTGLTHFRAMGDESTWGQLRYLLGQVDEGKSGRVDAWRFDWDSSYTPFETAAANLDSALAIVELSTGQTSVNLVAHSFGGILVRTYLEGLATGSGYNNDVNSVMTLGAPHSGIGGNLSTLVASACANASQFYPLSGHEPITCFEVSTGIPGGGAFLGRLDNTPLPQLLSTSSVLPQYDIITGQTSSCPGNGVCLFNSDDGLITTEGNKLCGASPGHFPRGIDVCFSLSVQEEINPGTLPTATGLCHSGALLGLTCSSFNVAMAEVNDTKHPLWDKICGFLGAQMCEPARVTVDTASCTISSRVLIEPPPYPPITLYDATFSFSGTVSGPLSNELVFYTDGLADPRYLPASATSCDSWTRLGQWTPNLQGVIECIRSAGQPVKSNWHTTWTLPSIKTTYQQTDGFSVFVMSYGGQFEAFAQPYAKCQFPLE